MNKDTVTLASAIAQGVATVAIAFFTYYTFHNDQIRTSNELDSAKIDVVNTGRVLFVKFGIKNGEWDEELANKFNDQIFKYSKRFNEEDKRILNDVGARAVQISNVMMELDKLNVIQDEKQRKKKNDEMSAQIQRLRDESQEMITKLIRIKNSGNL